MAIANDFDDNLCLPRMKILVSKLDKSDSVLFFARICRACKLKLSSSRQYKLPQKSVFALLTQQTSDFSHFRIRKLAIFILRKFHSRTCFSRVSGYRFSICAKNNKLFICSPLHGRKHYSIPISPLPLHKTNQTKSNTGSTSLITPNSSTDAQNYFSRKERRAELITPPLPFCHGPTATHHSLESFGFGS